MSFLSKILHYGRDEIRRAKDPATGEDWPRLPKPSLTIKFFVWLLKTSWGHRQLLKVIAALSGSLSVWLVAHGAGEHTSTIVTGAVAALTFILEMAMSWLSKKAGIEPTPLEQATAQNPVYLYDNEEPERRPSIFDLPARPLYQRLSDEQRPIAPQKFEVPGTLRREPPPKSIPEYSVKWKEAGEEKSREFDDREEARQFRDAKRRMNVWANMYPLILLCLFLPSCANDPVTGRKKYVGPNITFSAGYQGINAGITLWGVYGENKPVTITVPETVPIINIPLNSK